MNILSSFTHSQGVLNLNEFLFSVKHKSYFEECGKPKQLLVPSDFPILYVNLGPGDMIFLADLRYTVCISVFCMWIKQINNSSECKYILCDSLFAHTLT